MISSHEGVFGLERARRHGIPHEVISYREAGVELSDRIIMSPFAAKRLSMLLQNVIGQYESRFGTLEVVPTQTPSSPTN